MNLSDQEPRILTVLDQGEEHGPFNQAELRAWYEVPFDVLFDAPRSRIFVHRQSGMIDEIALVDRGELSTVHEIIRVLAEHPGLRMTCGVFLKYCKLSRVKNGLTGDTFKRYVTRARALIGDDDHDVICTDRSVCGGVSRSGAAYYANPKLRWVVIGYDLITMSV